MSKQIDNNNNTGESKTKVILKYKRIIAYLVAIIIGLLLVGGAFYFFGKESQKEFLIGLVSSSTAGILTGAVISVIVLLFTQKEEKEELNEIKEKLNKEKEKLSKTVAALRDLRGKLETCGKKGVILHKNRSELKLDDLIKNSRQNINIYVTNLGFLSNQFPALLQAAQRNVSVKILGTKPTNLFIATRCHELDTVTAEVFFGEIRTHLQNLRGKLVRLGRAPECFQVRLYVSQPTHMIFWFDYRLIVSFILCQGRANEQIHVEFDLNDNNVLEMAKDFITHFNKIWDENASNVLTLTPEVIDQLPQTYNLSRMEAQGMDAQGNKIIKTYSLNTE